MARAVHTTVRIPTIVHSVATTSKLSGRLWPGAVALRLRGHNQPPGLFHRARLCKVNRAAELIQVRTDVIRQRLVPSNICLPGPFLACSQPQIADASEILGDEKMRGVPARKPRRAVVLYPASLRYAGLSPVTHSRGTARDSLI